MRKSEKVIHLLGGIITKKNVGLWQNSYSFLKYNNGEQKKVKKNMIKGEINHKIFKNCFSILKSP